MRVIWLLTALISEPMLPVLSKQMTTSGPWVRRRSSRPCQVSSDSVPVFRSGARSIGRGGGRGGGERLSHGNGAGGGVEAHLLAAEGAGAGGAELLRGHLKGLVTLDAGQDHHDAIPPAALPSASMGPRSDNRG